MADNDTTAAYIPGVCNINRAEIARRRKAGYFGVGFFLVTGAVLIALGTSRWARIVLFVPAFIAAIGFLQAKNKFCVGYGGAGQQNASEGSSTAKAVTDKKAQAKDKSRARVMNMQAAVIAAIITALAVVT